ncbi:3-ketoacyl-reductase [Ramaria rubella]|nr:3-ketoacyl-reductase [Ramaria rubella]
MTPKVLPLKDQVVLVTGSSRGLGRAIALAFARQGVFGLVINSTQPPGSLDDLTAHINPTMTRVMVVKADVTKANEVEDMFASVKRQFGYPITTVVNNALARFSFNGDARPKLDAITWEDFDAQLKGSLQGAFNTTRAALCGMRECGFGRIINIGSNLVQNPIVPYHDYTAAKGALLAFTHTSAAELGPYNITVNLISGGLLKTTDASAATPPSVFALIEGTTPLRKSTSPEEMADAVLFFASPWARAVTGQSLCVDGGLVMT